MAVWNTIEFVARNTDAPPAPSAEPSPAVGYLASLAMVGAAGLAAFVVEHVVQAPNLALVFVLPVIVAAAAFGWGPSLLAAVAGVALFDFAFIEPRMTFVVARATDLWAMALLLLVGGFVSAVAAESRRRAMAARQAAEQAGALHELARTVLHAGPPAALLRAAVRTLARVFQGPAVILQVDAEQRLTQVAAEGGGALSAADLEAAAWVAETARPSHAQTYPFDRSDYDFWPATTAGGRRLVLGARLASRVTDAERTVELVAGYLAKSSV